MLKAKYEDCRSIKHADNLYFVFSKHHSILKINTVHLEVFFVCGGSWISFSQSSVEEALR